MSHTFFCLYCCLFRRTTLLKLDFLYGCRQIIHKWGSKTGSRGDFLNVIYLWCCQVMKIFIRWMMSGIKSDETDPPGHQESSHQNLMKGFSGDGNAVFKYEGRAIHQSWKLSIPSTHKVANDLGYDLHLWERCKKWEVSSRFFRRWHKSCLQSSVWSIRSKQIRSGVHTWSNPQAEVILDGCT